MTYLSCVYSAGFLIAVRFSRQSRTNPTVFRVLLDGPTPVSVSKLIVLPAEVQSLDPSMLSVLSHCTTVHPPGPHTRPKTNHIHPPAGRPIRIHLPGHT